MLSDCYVFPLAPGDSLTMPLSVLEAMACDLPVIATRFSGLVHAFTPGRGLTFVEHGADLLSLVRAMLAVSGSPGSRAMVQEYSWDSIANRLQDYYHTLVSA
jgi:glycosyltransferase involved in cell wall biosynthesis